MKPKGYKSIYPLPQIGDWVYNHKDAGNYRAMKVMAVHYTPTICTINTYFKASQISGIGITDKFLQKNDWVPEVGLESEWVNGKPVFNLRKKDWGYSYTSEMCGALMLTKREDKSFDLKTVKGEMICTLTFIHELQSVLRTFGYDADVRI